MRRGSNASTAAASVAATVRSAATVLAEKRERGAQRRQWIAGFDRERTLLLAELPAFGVERERQVRVADARQLEQLLQQNLTRRRIDEIGAAHDIA